MRASAVVSLHHKCDIILLRRCGRVVIPILDWGDREDSRNSDHFPVHDTPFVRGRGGSRPHALLCSAHHHALAEVYMLATVRTSSMLDHALDVRVPFPRPSTHVSDNEHRLFRVTHPSTHADLEPRGREPVAGVRDVRESTRGTPAT